MGSRTKSELFEDEVFGKKKLKFVSAPDERLFRIIDDLLKTQSVPFKFFYDKVFTYQDRCKIDRLDLDQQIFTDNKFIIKRIQ